MSSLNNWVGQNSVYELGNLFLSVTGGGVSCAAAGAAGSKASKPMERRAERSVVVANLMAMFSRPRR